MRASGTYAAPFYWVIRRVEVSRLGRGARVWCDEAVSERWNEPVEMPAGVLSLRTVCGRQVRQPVERTPAPEADRGVPAIGRSSLSRAGTRQLDSESISR